MRNTNIPRLDLTGQYKRATGEDFLFFNKRSSEVFNRFYQRRRAIGNIIFEQLRRRGYDLTDSRTLELYANIFDSIGIDYDTSVIDSDTSLLREEHANNLVSEHDQYDVRLIDGELSIDSIEEYNGTDRNWSIRHSINPNRYNSYVLLNPRNESERRLMVELLDSNYPCIVGYYGDEADMNLERHRTDINIMENNTRGHVIPHINVDGGYAYILTNNR